MVMYYSPEPRRDSEEGFNIEGAGIIIMGNDSSEEDEVTHTGNNQNEFGYELLPQEIPSGNSENVEIDSGNLMENPVGLSVRDHDLANNCGEALSMPEECANKDRPDMEINAEEVRAAMRNVTLPPSSFPPWAAAIPESQWTQFLFTRLGNNMQEQ